MNNRIRWSKVYESSEEELIAFLANRKLVARRVVATESSTQLQQVSEDGFTIWCAEGSLVVRQNSQARSVQPGDALHIAAGLPYDLVAGLTGYVCYTTL